MAKNNEKIEKNVISEPGNISVDLVKRYNIHCHALKVGHSKRELPYFALREAKGHINEVYEVEKFIDCTIDEIFENPNKSIEYEEMYCYLNELLKRMDNGAHDKLHRFYFLKPYKKIFPAYIEKKSPRGAKYYSPEELTKHMDIEEVEQDEDSKIQKEINNTVLDIKNHFEYTKEINRRPEQMKKGKVIYYKRSAKVSANALNHACYKCEINNDHKTFLRKKDEIPYTEAHHLIPMSQQGNFEFSLDIEENIISLCSNCHNEIHYGKNQNELLEKLFNERKDLLKSKGIEINLEELLSFYD